MAYHANQPQPPVIGKLSSRTSSSSREDYSSRTPSPVLIQPSYEGSQTSVHRDSWAPPATILPRFVHVGSSRSSSPSWSRRSHRHGHGRSHGLSKHMSHIDRHGSRPSTESGSARGTVFTAVDPFRPSVASCLSFTPDSHHSHHTSGYSGGLAPYIRWILLVDLKLLWAFFFDTLPRQLYLYFLLRLPALYFSRVARIFEEADMTMSEIKGMAMVTLVPMTDPNADWDHEISALTSRLKTTWEGFIDSLLREWKTLNIVSVLLMRCAP